MALNEALLAARNPADLAMESLRSLRTSLHFGVPRPFPPKVPPSSDITVNFIENEVHF